MIYFIIIIAILLAIVTILALVTDLKNSNKKDIYADWHKHTEKPFVAYKKNQPEKLK